MINGDRQGKIMFQLKSGNVKSGDITNLYGVMNREGAELGIFLTLKPPIKAMIKESKSLGTFQSRFMSQAIDKIQIVTIQEMIEENKRLDVKLTLEVLKSAEQQSNIHSDRIELKLE